MVISKWSNSYPDAFCLTSTLYSISSFPQETVATQAQTPWDHIVDVFRAFHVVGDGDDDGDIQVSVNLVP